MLYKAIIICTCNNDACSSKTLNNKIVNVVGVSITPMGHIVTILKDGYVRTMPIEHTVPYSEGVDYEPLYTSLKSAGKTFFKYIEKFGYNKEELETFEDVKYACLRGQEMSFSNKPLGRALSSIEFITKLDVNSELYIKNNKNEG